MDEKLFEAIKAADDVGTYAVALDEAICRLSKCQGAAELLTEDFRNAIVREQELWRQIEAMPEFKAKYDATLFGVADAQEDFRRELARREI